MWCADAPDARSREYSQTVARHPQRHPKPVSVARNTLCSVNSHGVFRAAATGDVISYDEITQFCQLHEGLIFAETSAAREILSGSTMQLPEQLEAEATKKENALEKALQEEFKRRDEIAMVDVEFERDSDENGVIPLSDCDYPFLLAVLMGTEPSFTRDMVHSCCV